MDQWLESRTILKDCFRCKSGISSDLVCHFPYSIPSSKIAILKFIDPSAMVGSGDACSTLSLKRVDCDCCRMKRQENFTVVEKPKLPSRCYDRKCRNDSYYGVALTSNRSLAATRRASKASGLASDESVLAIRQCTSVHPSHSLLRKRPSAS